MSRSEARQRRHRRVRKKVFGTPARPRLVVYRSQKHIYAQIIDDTEGRTVVSASTLDPAVRDSLDSTGNVASAREVGKLLASRAAEQGVRSVVFDRGGNLYHGRVAGLADGAREGGLEF